MRCFRNIFKKIYFARQIPAKTCDRLVSYIYVETSSAGHVHLDIRALHEQMQKNKSQNFQSAPLPCCDAR